MARVKDILLAFMCLSTLIACGEGEIVAGGVLGLSGTIAVSAKVVNSDIIIKDVNGNRIRTKIDANGKYSIGVRTIMQAPFIVQIIRKDAGSLYSIATERGVANVHPLSDIIVRNWFAFAGRDIDKEFQNGEAIINPPTKEEIDWLTKVFKKLLLPAYEEFQVAENFNFLRTDFATNNGKFYKLLDHLIVEIQQSKFSIKIIDPDTQIETTIVDRLDLAVNLSEPDLLAPSLAKKLKAIPAGVSEITLSWKASEDNIGVAGYNIYRSGEVIANTPFVVFKDTELTTDAEYCYVVEAYDGANNSSGKSAEICAATTTTIDTIVPDKTENLRTTKSGNNEIAISWDPSAAMDVLGYYLYRSEKDQEKEKIATLIAENYSDSKVQESTTYCYAIVAFDASGNLAPMSDESCLSTSAPSVTSAALVTVAENTRKVLTVEATAIDGGSLSFSLSGGVDRDVFNLNSLTGELVFDSAPNYEVPTDSDADNIYVIEVTVSDGANVVVQVIEVSVSNVNDNAPYFTSTDTAIIAENSLTITRIVATDIDGDVLTYSIVGGVDKDAFRLDSNNGLLNFASLPDFENPTDDDGDNVYSVDITVSDGINTIPQTINVTVSNINDGIPLITSPNTANIVENASINFILTAADIDNASVDLSFSLYGGADRDVFNLDAASGQLTFKLAPDYDIPADANGDNTYTLEVGVSDGSNTSTQIINIMVSNINDNLPIFTNGDNISVGVDENTIGIMTVLAEDADRMGLSYRISGGVDQNQFNINSTSGLLTFEPVPNYENPTDSKANNVYIVTVSASDGENTAEQNISVVVNNINDNTPDITSSDTAVVLENNTAVITLTATDADTGSQLNFSITGGDDQNLFSLNGSSGVLRFINAPDYENPLDSGKDNLYTVEVTVSDGNNTDSQVINITLTDENDNTPVFTSSDSVSVVENNTRVITVVASDGDAASSLSFSITGGDDRDAFNLDANSGELHFVNSPDYEAPTDDGADNLYVVAVTVSDGSNSKVQTINVTVTNDNDNLPLFTSSDSVLVAENNTAVLTVTATDADVASSLVFSITGGDDRDAFNLDANSGELRFGTAPDFEVPTDDGNDNLYVVEVSVSDGSNVLAQLINVTIVDENDNTPVFTSSDTISVVENNSEVLIVTATDADAASSLIFSITGGDDQNFFNINSSSGELRFVNNPDYEAPADDGNDNLYIVAVTVSDGSNSNVQTINVMVSNLNDNSPIFTNGSDVSVNRDENSIEVMTVVAEDADAEGVDLSYRISGGVDGAEFNIDPDNGLLSFINAPDYEDPTDSKANNVYIVTVSATDGENTAEQNISVVVNNINDNTPVITSSDTPEVLENSTQVITLTATDDDAGSQLNFSITGGDDQNFFSINSSSGVLRFINAPDYETPLDSGNDNLYAVEVAVSDGRYSPTQIINVSVTNDNDNAPVFTSNDSFLVAENNTAVTLVTATDADVGSSLSYRISGGDDLAFFALDDNTGELYFLNAPDYETPLDSGNNNLYIVEIEASDGLNAVQQLITVSVFDRNENPPSNVAAIAGDQRVTLSWDAPPGTLNAIVYWSTTSGVGAGGTAVVSEGTVFYHDGVNNGISYYYTVATLSTAGESPISAEVSATPMPIALESLVFADANLAACVAEQAVTYVNELNSLTCLSKNINDITGIEALTALTDLDLYNNTISELAALAGLIKLEELTLWNNTISDISPLADLTVLRFLDLDSNNIVDVSGLAALSSLRTLWLINNALLSDISALASLTTLTKLYLHDNNISDVGSLFTLTALETLHLQNNSISEIQGLASLEALTELNVQNNNIDDIAALTGLVNLQVLFMLNNAIADVTALANLVNLEQLQLDNNFISTGVADLVSLINASLIRLDSNPDILCADLTTLDTVLDAANGADSGIVTWNVCTP